MLNPIFFPKTVLHRSLAACLIGPVVLPLSVSAQTITSASVLTQQFTIKAGPLGPALNQFAQAAGIYLGEMVS